VVVRLPRHADYAPQIEKEFAWLPKLASRLPLEIPVPLAIGKPSDAFGLPWAVYEWIDGDVALPERVSNLRDFATDFATFIRALHRIEVTQDAEKTLRPSCDNGHRGGLLSAYSPQITEACSLLRDKADVGAVEAVWQRALDAAHANPPVWVHGDLSVGNMLVREGKLVAVIDFGNMAIGDPACDLVLAWNVFDTQARLAFRDALELDDDTWVRGRAWALWKAVIIAAELDESNAYESRDPWRVIDTILRDYSKEN
jgi:aminoglycoside phosphotransferase (APT) family kinase protein